MAKLKIKFDGDTIVKAKDGEGNDLEVKEAAADSSTMAAPATLGLTCLEWRYYWIGGQLVAKCVRYG